jgi:hypothetical protein
MFLEHALEYLEEVAKKRRPVKTSMVRMNKNRKRNLYAGRVSISLAKKKNKAAYKRYLMKKNAFLKEKAKLKRMYKAQSKRIAKSTIR